jgi:hypothetical protein
VTRAGEELAEVRPDPAGGSPALVFRVPRGRFEVGDISQELTLEDLLTAAAVPAAAVESWQVGGETHPGLGGGNPELTRLLPVPPPDATHLTVLVRLNPPAPATARPDPGGPDIPPETWQALEGRWKAILGVEAGIDALRQSVEAVRAEMEAEARKAIGVEEKVHALQADVAQWNKAKSRVHYAVPKAREFVHRATWAAGVPERQRLEELYRAYIQPRVPFPDPAAELERLDHFQKARQVLAAQGAAVYQECRGILADVQRALGTLRRNAADRATQKRRAGREKGKHF